MDPHELDQRLSHISTLWTLLGEANQQGTAAVAARQVLMRRYCGAVYRYLYGAVRDPNVADDLTQEFALRFLQGRFRQANPAQGRFRNYIKTALFHLVNDYHRRKGREPRALPLQADEAVSAPDEVARAEQAFCESWRQELLARAWKALEQVQRETGQPFHEVLRFRVDHPDLSSAEMAERLSARLGKALTAAGVRKTLERARDRFADLLLDDVRTSLEGAGDEQVEEELAELNLLKYCRDALQRRARNG
jgi:RNA polymerase sigma-70 factor (ECF subfamily)